MVVYMYSIAQGEFKGMHSSATLAIHPIMPPITERAKTNATLHGVAPNFSFMLIMEL